MLFPFGKSKKKRSTTKRRKTTAKRKTTTKRKSSSASRKKPTAAQLRVRRAFAKRARAAGGKIRKGSKLK